VKRIAPVPVDPTFGVGAPPRPRSNPRPRDSLAGRGVVDPAPDHGPDTRGDQLDRAGVIPVEADLDAAREPGGACLRDDLVASRPDPCLELALCVRAASCPATVIGMAVKGVPLPGE